MTPTRTLVRHANRDDIFDDVIRQNVFGDLGNVLKKLRCHVAVDGDFEAFSDANVGYLTVSETLERTSRRFSGGVK